MANKLPHWRRLSIASLFLNIMWGEFAQTKEELPNWTRSTEFAEASFTTTNDDKVRIHVNAPLDTSGKPARATRIVVYGLPAGNTIEQTLGSRTKPGLHWRYDIQHVAAQVRLLRSLMPSERIVLVCPEGPGLSWTPFRKAHADANTRMGQLVEKWRKEFGTHDARVMLTGHSNGGSFMFGVIDAADAIPDYIDRIAFLDANYNFDAAKHTGKIDKWLAGNDQRRLIVIAYDDREIMYEGKKVLGPTGGTYRATGRMHDAFGKLHPLTEKSNPPFMETTGLKGRIHFYVCANPENKILHTVLVGEMNGFVHAATLGTPFEEKWGRFGGPRAYTKWVQAEPTPAPAQPKSKKPLAEQPAAAKSAAVKTASSKHATLATAKQLLPARPKGAMGGKEFMKKISSMSREEREAPILREITSGNFPEFLRVFKKVPIVEVSKNDGKEISATIEVMPDYLAVGSDRDFVRIPMTPHTAQQIADRFGCTLPTRKMVDAIDRVGEVHLAPQPMTHDRETVATFVEHNTLIEKQRGDQPLGALIIGIKKDIVLTPRIFEKPKRLAIYGWRQLNGQPIQPLAIVHVDWYVDYSHGVRLVRDRIELNGKSAKISEVLADANHCGLVSDEGPMKPPRYPEK